MVVVEEVAAEPAPRARKKVGDDEVDEDEEVVDPDDVEADLDTILKDRIAAADDEEDEEEVEVADARGPETPDGVTPKKANEFVCTGLLPAGQPRPVRPGRPDDVPGGRERLPGHHRAAEGQEVAARSRCHGVPTRVRRDRRPAEEPGRPVVRALRLRPARASPSTPASCCRASSTAVAARWCWPGWWAATRSRRARPGPGATSARARSRSSALLQTLGSAARGPRAAGRPRRPRGVRGRRAGVPQPRGRTRPRRVRRPTPADTVARRRARAPNRCPTSPRWPSPTTTTSRPRRSSRGSVG